MISKEQVIEKLSFALMEPNLNEDSNSSNTNNWDSLGQLAILATLSKLTDKKTDSINELRESESIADIFALLSKHSLLT